MRSRLQLGALLLIAALASAGMWFYVDHILVGYQVADATVHQRPRGNLSDLYPRWLGARELLLRHRNPYGNDVTKEIQKGYYGRELDASRPNDPKDRQGFAYPVYVIFLLAPLVGLPFSFVQLFFHWLLLALTAGSVWLWLRALRWQLSPLAIAICIVFVLGCFPAVQGIKLQQLSLIVAALLAASAACAGGGFLFCSGALLAAATIKPQLAWPFVAWMLLWTGSDWRRRRHFAFGFSAVMALLLAGAEIILPGWLPMFVRALGEYHRYTQNQSVLLLPWGISAIFIVAAALACAWQLWKLRRVPADNKEFGLGIALALALTVLVVPMYAPYNQLLLLPAVLVVLRGRNELLGRSRAVRFVFAAGTLALVWQWIASLGLCAAYLLGMREWALGAWKAPFFATFTFPVFMFALIFLTNRGMSDSANDATGESKKPGQEYL